MAGVALLLRYQWRAYWRRFSRGGGQAPAQVLLLCLLGWLIFIKSPPLLMRAANEIALGKTGGINAILLIYGFAWLVILHEDSNICLTATDLFKFPLSVDQLIGLRIISMFFSPVVMIIVIGSLTGLLPFLKSPNPTTGIAAAIIFFSLAAIIGICLSTLMGIAVWRRWLFASAAIIVIPPLASLFASGDQTEERLTSMLAALVPVHLVSSVATGVNLRSTVIPILLLLAFSVLASLLLRWSFRQRLSAQQSKRSYGRLDFIKLPGKLGGLVGKEQRYFLKTIFPWLGLLITLACSLALFTYAVPPIAFQSAILLVFWAEFDLTVNLFGIDRASELNRYLILPLRFKEIVLGKNLGIIVILAAQLAPMLAIACWRFGWVECGIGLIEATGLMLAYLAWGNLRSVNNPYKMGFLQLTSKENIVFAIAGSIFGSLPGVAIIYLDYFNSNYLFIKIVFILALAAAVYLGSLHAAGKKLARNWNTIWERLA